MPSKLIPQQIETEYGRTVVIESVAKKQYKCPLCDDTLDPGENHMVLIPESDESARRHVHTLCLQEWIKQGLEIKLHPNSRTL